MQTLLMSIQKDVAKYAEMINTVFDVQVDCADVEKTRIAATGKYKNKVGKPLHSGKVFSKAMQTGEIIFVSDPTNDPICKGCINQSICKNQCEVCFPIELDGEVIGAINIGSANEKQYRTILDNYEKLTLFMSNITDMISLKAGEYRDQKIKKYNLELQEKLINLIRAGVMIIDGDGMVVYMNMYCENVLGCSCRRLPYLVKMNKFSITQKKVQANGDAEYLIKIHAKHIRLVGTISKIPGIEEGTWNTVFMFSDIKSAPDEILEDNNPEKYKFSKLIGQSPVFLHMVEQCRQEAVTSSPVLLIGESGTKKEMFAKMMHNESIRHSNRFIRVSYRTPLEQLVRDVTNGGDILESSALSGVTLYVDEVGDLNLADQRMLLEILSNSRFSNTKVICATEKDLSEITRNGNFYPELLASLEGNVIRIPALRTRGRDILLYADHYLKRYNEQYSRHLTFSKDFRSLMLRYSWKGNVQELKNMISFLVQQADESVTELSPETIPSFIIQKFMEDQKDTYNLARAEKKLILQALNDFGSGTRSKKRVAEELGISNATLYRKLKEYGITENNSFN